MSTDNPAYRDCLCDEDEQCARCGSSVCREDCETCATFGYYGDEPDPLCPACEGTGMTVWCLSDYDWCQAHPQSGRENVKPHTPEVFKVHEAGCSNA